VLGQTRLRSIFLSLIFLLSQSSLASAWEADVHFGLTKWLAIQAGFDRSEAETIAYGNRQVDRSRVTGPILSTILTCTGMNDVAGSRQIHNDHFPSERNPPEDPTNRQVTAGQTWEDHRPRILPDLDGTLQQLFALGFYLHALQDSWSHQGEPDVPDVCDKTLGWGHALSRGGWTCHLADLTYRWPSDTLAMAKKTYEVLTEARKTVSPTPWSQLEPKVHEFAMAHSKWAKDTWFSQNLNESGSGFLEETSLPDSDPGRPLRPYPPNLKLWIETVSNNPQPPSGDIPAQFAELFRMLFTELTTKTGEQISRLIDYAAAAKALLRAVHAEETADCPYYNVIAPFLLHEGFQSGRGARTPLEVCEMATDLRQKARKVLSCGEVSRAAAEGIQNAQPHAPPLAELAEKGPQLPRVVYAVAPGATSGTYLAFARFMHLPLDVLVVQAAMVPDQQNQPQPKVIGFAWMPVQ